ncbi:hypothetical protein [Alkalinema sp. FACHB-956]|uniref:hypothetical protein n=1 Tax=Alkalinema sp. FACHB-956 TaxID=2692768 RepID=UPI00168A2DEA|nr:hypothetical protein [Alkalinema sp. FACHB-956]MBD2327639.1 hypothetical protein [Alkalinema sp. FACHB-956]
MSAWCSAIVGAAAQRRSGNFSPQGSLLWQSVRETTLPPAMAGDSTPPTPK